MKRTGWRFGLGLIVVGLVYVLSCGKNTGSDTNEVDETGQQVGDTMASIDEAGTGAGGGIALIEGARRTFARLAPQSPSFLRSWLQPEAQAAACRTITLGACTNNVRIRDFADCTVLGGSVFHGKVTLTWDDLAVDNTCQMTSNGHSISRAPDFSIEGRFGGVFTVKKTGVIGQRITKQAAADTFKFSNDGIQRTFTRNSTVLFDFTTKTLSDVTITGATRPTRVVDGGSLEITNNKNGNICTLVPKNLTWDGTCNCAVSGSVEGTCDNGKTGKVEITGCGTANVTRGDTTQTVVFDRCFVL